MSIFRRQKTLTESQEEDERLSTDVSIARKRAMIRELERREGPGSWKMFSDNNKKSGINFSRVLAWLKHH